MKHVLYCDLEMTLINSWEEFEFINISIPLLDRYDGLVNIFSYAVDNESDLQKIKSLLPHFENYFHRKFAANITVSEIADFLDMTIYQIKNRGKRQGFIDYITYFEDEPYENTTYILIDDLVEPETIKITDNMNILFLNPFRENTC